MNCDNKCVTLYTDKEGCLVYSMNQGAKHNIQILAEIEVAKDIYLPIDLSGQDSIEINFKKQLSQSGRAIISKSLGNGIEIDSNDKSIMIITLDKEDTEGCCMNLIGTLSIIKGEYREDLLNIKLDIHPITNKL